MPSSRSLAIEVEDFVHKSLIGVAVGTLVGASLYILKLISDKAKNKRRRHRNAGVGSAGGYSGGGVVGSGGGGGAGGGATNAYSDDPNSTNSLPNQEEPDPCTAYCPIECSLEKRKPEKKNTNPEEKKPGENDNDSDRASIYSGSGSDDDDEAKKRRKREQLDANKIPGI